MASKIWKACFALALILMVSTAAFAQGEIEVDPDATIPVDGGLSLLIAAGVGYGVKRLVEQREQRKK